VSAGRAGGLTCRKPLWRGNWPPSSLAPRPMPRTTTHAKAGTVICMPSSGLWIVLHPFAGGGDGDTNRRGSQRRTALRPHSGQRLCHVCALGTWGW
jgi:hypothetical protein